MSQTCCICALNRLQVGQSCWGLVGGRVRALVAVADVHLARINGSCQARENSIYERS